MDIDIDGGALYAALGLNEPEEGAEPDPEEAETDEKEKKSIHVSHRMGLRQQFRKAASEKALEEALDWHFHEGDSYHCFSFGDVDSFTFFKAVLKQQYIKYAALSTWCMAGEDVLDLTEWYRRGLIGRVDFFMGEIFKGSYPEVYAKTMDFVKEESGRLVIFRNHSKVMVIQGEHFDCLIESSANINTNPRSENTVITVDRELTREYLRLFSEIKPFNKDYGAEPYMEF